MPPRKNKFGNERKAAPTSLKSAINDMLDAYDLKRQLNETDVIDSWGTIMGKTVASRTTKLFFKDKKLIVELSSAPLKHELSLSKGKILTLFSDKFGVGIVEDILFL